FIAGVKTSSSLARLAHRPKALHNHKGQQSESSKAATKNNDPSIEIKTKKPSISEGFRMSVAGLASSRLRLSSLA
ncbi:hypothetical protein, partial [Rhizobium sp. CF142]|uniref:hypothetical protein n=1 Tax=Rhizobium sp. CF142 TaxID=1144314 RepID=UPI001AEC55D4